MREITRKAKRRQCICCGKKAWKISQHGLCVDCATEKVQLARLQIKHKSGPFYEKWRESMIKTLGL